MTDTSSGAAHAIKQSASPEPYEDWFASVFGKRIPAPGARIATSWADESVWGQRAHCALVAIECDYVRTLLQEIHDKEIEGDLVEFGIFQGWWINFLWEETEKMGLLRRVYGFDSFEGLSEPDTQFDLSSWKKGQYACGLAQVSKNVREIERPRIRLAKGFFDKSLHGADARLAGNFCYARIDCDLYRPALECLEFLSNRLVDGAILVFDDWPHMLGYGEQRAFQEWLPSVPHLNFEFLFYNTIGHFYLCVHHKRT